jgi:hypothetical protein
MLGSIFSRACSQLFDRRARRCDLSTGDLGELNLPSTRQRA